MSDRELAGLTTAISEVLTDLGGVRLAVLFGSRAKGIARSDSDVDLAVDAPGLDLSQLAARLSERLGHEVDVALLSQASIPLLKELIDDGVVVWQSEPGAGALWRSRVLAQLETDGPWYERMRDAWLGAVAARGLSSGP